MSDSPEHVSRVRALGWNGPEIVAECEKMTSSEIRDVLPHLQATGSAGAKMDATRETVIGILRERESRQVADRLGEAVTAVKTVRDEIERTATAVEAARLNVEGTRDEVKKLNASSSLTAWIAIAIAVAALLVAMFK